MTGDAYQDRDIDTLRQQPQADLNTIRMGLEMIQGCVPSRAEVGFAALAFQGLDMAILPSFPVSHNSMNLLVSYAEVIALWIGTGMTLCPDPFLTTPCAFAFSPGLDIPPDGVDVQADT